MAAEIERVSLKQLLDISKTLKNIVCRSYGPRCNSTLLATSTGQILITSDGIKLLKSLNIEHPIGRLIIDAVSKQHQIFSDGVKTFILYLTEFLFQLTNLQEKEDTSLISFSNLIPEFMEKILPGCLECCKKKGLVVLDVRFCANELDCFLCDFIKTIFIPNLHENHVKFFSDLISTVIMNGTNSISRVLERANLFCDHFENLHIELTGPYLTSRSISGILLKNFVCHIQEFTKNSNKFVILKNSIDGNKIEDPEEIVRISTEESLDASFTNAVKITEKFLKKLKDHSVDLILMSEHLPHFAVTLCCKYQINVIDGLDVQEINMVERLTSISSLSSVFDRISEKNIKETEICQKVKLGNKIFANLHFENCLYIKSFVLCAPTEGLCGELSSLIYKCFKNIKMAVNNTETSCKNSKLTREILNYIYPESSSLESNNEDVLKGYLSKTSTVEDEPSSHSVCSTSEPKILLVPAGGYFEFELAKSIKNATDSFRCEEFGILGKIIFETLLSVPRKLHTNLCERVTNKKRQFTEMLQNVLSSEQGLSIDSHGYLYAPSGSDCQSLESFNLKVATLQNVLQLVHQLLRLEFIIGVRSLKS